MRQPAYTPNIKFPKKSQISSPLLSVCIFAALVVFSDCLMLLVVWWYNCINFNQAALNRLKISSCFFCYCVII